MQRTAQAGEATEGAGGRTAAGVEDVGKVEQIRLRAGTGEVPEHQQSPSLKFAGQSWQAQEAGK